MSQCYQEVIDEDIKDYFKVDLIRDKLVLRICDSSKPIFVNSPFVLNEDVATLAGLMPDGSLIKDLMRIYFHQKKDLSKIYLFKNLLIKLFSPQGSIIISEGKNAMRCYINSNTLANFFYYILKIPKSDEPMNVPDWIFKSPKSVQIAYLKQAFDMEGTILKKLTEIRFAVKDEIFAENMKKLLFCIGIKSTLTFAPRLTVNLPQYRVHIYGKENFIKFKEIGFRIPFLKERFDRLLDKYNI